MTSRPRVQVAVDEDLLGILQHSAILLDALIKALAARDETLIVELASEGRSMIREIIECKRQLAWSDPEMMRRAMRAQKGS